jgi:hypothetical protein
MDEFKYAQMPQIMRLNDAYHRIDPLIEGFRGNRGIMSRLRMPRLGWNMTVP